MRRLQVICAAAIASAAITPTAQAAERWATPTPSGDDGATCTALDPCSLSNALTGAVAGDHVVVSAGVYAVSSTVAVGDALVLRAATGATRPVLAGAGNLSFPTLDVGAAAQVRGLAIEAHGTGADAMTVRAGALVENVIATSASGDGAKVVGGAATTVVRDSVVTTGSGDAGSAALKLRNSGGATSGDDVALVNVTAWASSGSAVGVRCETDGGRSTLLNTLVRGAAADVALKAGADCLAVHSNLRSATGLATDRVSDAAPLLADPAAGDFRPLAGSPTIDAGTASAWLGAADPDGRSRTAGNAPDVGAFEHPLAAPLAPAGGGGQSGQEPTLTGSDTTTTTGKDAKTPGTQGTPDAKIPGLPSGVAPPALGKTVVLAPAQGTITVKVPGAARYVALGKADDLPVGTVIDASRGAVRLSTALPAGLQTGTFSGGRFEVRQPRFARGLTDLILRGGSFAACPRPGSAPRARTAARRKAVRRLWGRDAGGRFRTRGRTSVATVRGTVWLTEDRCEGTLTRVTEGAVSVRDLRRGGRSVLVRAGAQRLVRVARR